MNKSTKYRNILRNKLKFEIIFFLIVTVIILICLSPVFRGAGWPGNHAGFGAQDLSIVYAEHFKQGDIFPIWSSNDGLGMGSPSPLYYQKTFFYISGLILLLLHSIKPAIIITLGLFMFIGAYGMRFCVEKFSNYKSFIIVTPLIFLLSNYSFTDWLVRGDVAEFSAMMLGIWVIWWCLNLIIDKKFSLSIIAILFLLINAHNIVSVFAMVPIIIAYILFLLDERVVGFRRTIKKLLVSVFGLSLLMAPELIIEYLFLRNYDPSKITQYGYLSTDHFIKFTQYFYNPNFIWLKIVGDYTVQIDYGIWVPILLGGIIILIALITHSSSCQRQWLKAKFLTTPILFMVINLSIFLFLQLSISKIVYIHLFPLQYLQFPWRLMVYITPLSILLMVYMITRLSLKYFAGLFVIIWLAIFLVLSPLLHQFQFGFYLPMEFNPSLSRLNTDELESGAYLGDYIWGGGEYLPRVYSNGQELTELSTSSLFENLYQANLISQTISGGPCNIAQIQQRNIEPLTITLELSCSSPAKLAIPVSYNDFSIIQDITQHRTIHYSRIDDTDPRIVIYMPKTANEILKISLPNFTEVLGTYLKP